MSDRKTLTGGCLCAATRYEATGTPGLTLICHCRMCQRVSGGPFMGLLFLPSEAVQVTKGAPLLYPASPTSNRHFCGRCGSPLFFERHTREITGLTVGSLDEPYDFKPQMHLCVESAMAWLNIHDAAPRHAKKPEGMTPPVEYNPLTGQTRPPEPEQAGPKS
jgi:hypothetical protein